MQVVHEPNGEVHGIYFQTESQRKLYSKIGTVLEMDGTYGTNNVGFSLYHLMWEDNNGESQPVAQYFTKTETKGALSDFLRIFTEVFTLYYLTWKRKLIMNHTYRLTTWASLKSPLLIRAALRSHLWNSIFQKRNTFFAIFISSNLLAIAWTKRLMDTTLLNNTRMKYGIIFATLCMLRRRKP